MSVHDLLASVRKHWFLIAALTVLSTGGMLVWSMMTVPMYQASTTMFYTLARSSSGADSYSGSSYIRDQMLSFGRLATTPQVLDPAIDELGLDLTAAQMDDGVSVTVPNGTNILVIGVTDSSPEAAADKANAIAASLVTQTAKLSPEYVPPAGQEVGPGAGKPLVKATVIKQASIPSAPVSPRTTRNTLAGFIMGFVGGIVIAYIRDLLDTRVRRAEDVEAVLHAPVLAKISRRRKSESADPAGPAWNTGSRAEEFRRFRTNLEYLDVGQEEVCVIFSSALPGEGKTTTCAGLAEVLAESGKRVLVIDADLRRPRLAAHWGLTSDVGLTTVLIGRASLEDVVQPVGDKLDVLASGAVPPNPSELLDSPPMRSLLGIAQQRYDIVVVDAPPLLPVADAVILSRISSGIILVADSRKVRANQLREAAQSVTTAGGVVRGVVLNRVRESRQNAYQYESTPAAMIARPRPRTKPAARPAPEVRALPPARPPAAAGGRPRAIPVRPQGSPPPSVAPAGKPRSGQAMMPEWDRTDFPSGQGGPRRP